MESAVSTDLLLDLQGRIVASLEIADDHGLAEVGIALDQALQQVANLLQAAGLADLIVAVEPPAGPDGTLRFMPAR